jgi:hypothetical protein
MHKCLIKSATAPLAHGSADSLAETVNLAPFQAAAQCGVAKAHTLGNQYRRRLARDSVVEPIATDSMCVSVMQK